MPNETKTHRILRFILFLSGCYPKTKEEYITFLEIKSSAFYTYCNLLRDTGFELQQKEVNIGLNTKVGTWIETSYKLIDIGQIAVVPRVGAWIETYFHFGGVISSFRTPAIICRLLVPLRFMAGAAYSASVCMTDGTTALCNHDCFFPVNSSVFGIVK